MGDNGILVQATGAKKQQSLAEEKEKIQFASGAAGMKGLGIISEVALTEAMNGEFGSGNWVYAETPTADKDYFLVKVNESGKEYKILKNGTVSIASEGNGGAGGEIPEPEPEPEEDSWDIGIEKTNDVVLEKLGINKDEWTGSYDGNWQIMGEENGKVKLISTKSVGTGITLGYNQRHENAVGNAGSWERVIWSYENAIKTLNEEAISKTGIDTARSVNVDDINNLLGITTEEQKAALDSRGNYGDTYQYKFQDYTIYSRYLDYGKENIEENWSSWKNTYNTFLKTDTQIIDRDNGLTDDIIEITMNYYEYDIEDYDYKGVSSILGDYWLASKKISGNIPSSGVGFGLRTVYSNHVNSRSFWSSTTTTPIESSGMNFGVRAIIYIDKSSI